jgi:hypothetical protein
MRPELRRAVHRLQPRLAQRAHASQLRTGRSPLPQRCHPTYRTCRGPCRRRRRLIGSYLRAHAVLIGAPILGSPTRGRLKATQPAGPLMTSSETARRPSAAAERVPWVSRRCSLVSGRPRSVGGATYGNSGGGSERAAEQSTRTRRRYASVARKPRESSADHMRRDRSRARRRAMPDTAGARRPSSQRSWCRRPRRGPITGAVEFPRFGGHGGSGRLGSVVA